MYSFGYKEIELQVHYKPLISMIIGSWINIK